MCEKKKYTQQIGQFVEDLHIRIVYSSLSNFMGDYAGKIVTGNPGCSFRERIITQEEAQAINVDDVSAELDLSIEDIISQKVYVVTNFKEFEGYTANLYIGTYFTDLFFDLKGQTLNPELTTKIWELLDMPRAPKLFDATSYSCCMHHSVYATPKELWKVLDKDAFPNIEPNPINWQMSETHQHKPFTIDLNRNLRKVADEEDTYTSYITTIVHIPHPDPEKQIGKELLEQALHLLHEESTLCFSKELNA